MLSEAVNFTNELSHILTKDEQTPMIHLYRAEVGRLSVYKQRMDTPIHWLITSSIFIWTLCAHEKINVIFSVIFTFFITFMFHVMDIYRYIAYSNIRCRCNLMEKGMYTYILDESNQNGLMNWKRKLIDTWNEDTNCIDVKKAFLLRLRNVFIYMYAFQIFLFILIYIFSH